MPFVIHIMRIMPGIGQLSNKKILLRCDFDVSVADGKITESFRIQKQKILIDYLLDRGVNTVMIAHISAIESFKSILPELENILGRKIKLIRDLGFRISDLEFADIALLDNIRRWPGEEKNDDIFSRSLASGFDIYVNNAFAVCHRRHASISAITKFLPSYAGFLVEEETTQLNKMINLPKDGKIFIIGGAKAKTKVPVIKNFIDKSQHILVGGVVANDILKEMGADIGLSIADRDTAGLLEGLDLRDNRLMIPFDFSIFEKKIFDIGPKTVNEYVNVIKSAKVIIWNGPMGLFEDERFSGGTNAIAKATAESKGFKTIGGGDTIAAAGKLGFLDKFDFVSTGGGAMLEFLAGNKLPGLEVLGYYD